MEHPFDLVVRAMVLFASTNIDDLLVLVGFLSDPGFRARHVAAGQFIGIATLYGISVAGSLVSLIVPPAVVGLLGLVPIGIGLKKLWELKTQPGTATVASVNNEMKQPGRPKILAVFLVTVANGGDNLSVYIPLFAMRSAVDIAMIGIVFAMMTAGWLAFAYWLTQHRTTGAAVRRYGRLLMPGVLIALGALIVTESGTLNLHR